MRGPGAEALAGDAVELHRDRVFRQARMAIALGDFARQHGAGGAVGVADLRDDFDRRSRVRARAWPARSACGRECARCRGSAPRPCCVATGPCTSGLAKIFEKSRPLAFQWLIASCWSSHSVAPISSSERLDAHGGHEFAHLFGDEEEIVDDMLGLALEALAQFRILRGNADRAGVEMALAHHDAARGNQRRRGKANLIGAEQCGDHHIAAGADAAIGLHRDAAAQIDWRPASAGFRPGRFPTGEPACLIEVSGEAPVPPS